MLLNRIAALSLRNHSSHSCQCAAARCRLTCRLARAQQLQARSNEPPRVNKLRSKLFSPVPSCCACRPATAVMVEAFQGIWELHVEDKIPLRVAAFVKALQRVTRARVHRGFD